MLVRDTVIAELEDHFPDFFVINEATTLESLGADSLDRLEIAMDLEDHYDVSVTDKADVVKDVRTVGDLIDLFSAALEAKK